MLITPNFGNCFVNFALSLRFIVSSLGVVVSLVALHYKGFRVIILLLQTNVSEVFLFCQI